MHYFIGLTRFLSSKEQIPKGLGQPGKLGTEWAGGTAWQWRVSGGLRREKHMKFDLLHGWAQGCLCPRQSNLKYFLDLPLTVASLSKCPDLLSLPQAPPLGQISLGCFLSSPGYFQGQFSRRWSACDSTFFLAPHLNQVLREPGYSKLLNSLSRGKLLA